MTPFGILFCIALGLLFACIEFAALFIVVLLECRRLKREEFRRKKSEAREYNAPTNEF